MNQNFFPSNDESEKNDLDIEYSAIENKTYKSKKDEIEQRWLIDCLAIGISEAEFWTLNPHKVRLRIQAHKKKLEEKDYELWLQGKYNMCAFNCVLSSAFGKRTKYPDEPVLKSNRELTDSEKIEKTKELFKSLEIMQANFEIFSD